jgi:hypothetical protein
MRYFLSPVTEFCGAVEEKRDKNKIKCSEKPEWRHDRIREHPIFDQMIETITSREE